MTLSCLDPSKWKMHSVCRVENLDTKVFNIFNHELLFYIAKAQMQVVIISLNYYLCLLRSMGFSLEILKNLTIMATLPCKYVGSTLNCFHAIICDKYRGESSLQSPQTFLKFFWLKHAWKEKRIKLTTTRGKTYDGSSFRCPNIV